jgi:hypothetical protein
VEALDTVISIGHPTRFAHGWSRREASPAAFKRVDLNSGLRHQRGPPTGVPGRAPRRNPRNSSGTKSSHVAFKPLLG